MREEDGGTGQDPVPLFCSAAGTVDGDARYRIPQQASFLLCGRNREPCTNAGMQAADIHSGMPKTAGDVLCFCRAELYFRKNK